MSHYLRRTAGGVVAILLTFATLIELHENPAGIARAASPVQQQLADGDLPRRSPPYTIRSNVDLVVVEARVFDAKDQVVPGLSKENFTVVEDRKVQRVEFFSTDQTPLSVGLVMDVSASMGPNMSRSREAVAEFLQAAPPEDEFLLIRFSNQAETVSGFTHDRASLLSALNTLEARGDTALLDAIHLGLKEMATAAYDRQILLVFSDGADNRSRHRIKDVENLVRERGVQIFCIGIGLEPVSSFWQLTSAGRFAGPKLLKNLATTSGGRYFAAETVDDLPAIREAVDRMMRSAYTFGYKPSNQQNDGKWRKLQVRVNPSPMFRSKYRVIHKPGYYAPSK